MFLVNGEKCSKEENEYDALNLFVKQVINHEIPKELLKDAMSVFTEFCELPFKDKSHLYSEELNENCRLYTSSYNYAREEIHYWRDCLKHNCSCLEENIDYWPQKPVKYR